MADDEGQGESSETRERGGQSEKKGSERASQQGAAKDAREAKVGVTGVVDFDDEVSRFEARQRLIQSLAKRKKRGDGGGERSVADVEASQGETRRGESEERRRWDFDERSRGEKDGRVGRGFDEGMLGELERGFRDLEAKIDSHTAGGLRAGEGVRRAKELREAEGPSSSGLAHGGSASVGGGEEGTGEGERAESRGGQQQRGGRNNGGSPDGGGKDRSAGEEGGFHDQSKPAAAQGSTPLNDRSGATTDGQDRSEFAASRSHSAVEHSESPEHRPQGEGRSDSPAPGGTAAGVESPPGQSDAGHQTEPSGAAADRSEGAPANGDRRSVPVGNPAHGSDTEKGRGHDLGKTAVHAAGGASAAKAPGGTFSGRRPAVVERTPFEAGRPSASVGVSPVDTMAHLERLSQVSLSFRFPAFPFLLSCCPFRRESLGRKDCEERKRCGTEWRASDRSQWKCVQRISGLRAFGTVWKRLLSAVLLPVVFVCLRSVRELLSQTARFCNLNQGLPPNGLRLNRPVYSLSTIRFVIESQRMSD